MVGRQKMETCCIEPACGSEPTLQKRVKMRARHDPASEGETRRSWWAAGCPEHKQRSDSDIAMPEIPVCKIQWFRLGVAGRRRQVYQIEQGSASGV